MQSKLNNIEEKPRSNNDKKILITGKQAIRWGDPQRLKLQNLLQHKIHYGPYTSHDGQKLNKTHDVNSLAQYGLWLCPIRFRRQCFLQSVHLHICPFFRPRNKFTSLLEIENLISS